MSTILVSSALLRTLNFSSHSERNVLAIGILVDVFEVLHFFVDEKIMHVIFTNGSRPK